MRHFNFKKLTSILGIAALSFSLISCGASGSDSSDKTDSTKSEKTPVRVAYFPNITHTQALVLKSQGKLEEKWKDKVLWKLIFALCVVMAFFVSVSFIMNQAYNPFIYFNF